MITVRILVIGTSELKGSKAATIDIKQGSRTNRMVVTSTVDLHLAIGDSIACVFGSAVAMINPGSLSGAYILTTTPPPENNGKYLTVLKIDAETVRHIHRGSIIVSDDISTILTATTAVTR